ncbi:unnamed protein product [Anisakis simplex]|uniref:BAG family molecular chaperone regulator 2 (inferred by orthology to a human protein) n=1 Tax=Anisakis simplex TaxID=6269 RepID=A0A0M3KC99_ANISI|nr:unnamed protein product [Anisakis simplex]
MFTLAGLPRTSPCGRIFAETNGDDSTMSNNNNVGSSGSGGGGSRVVPVQLIRKTSIDDFNEQMVGMLDEVERRVEQLRLVARCFFLLNFQVLFQVFTINQEARIT